MPLQAENPCGSEASANRQEQESGDIPRGSADSSAQRLMKMGGQGDEHQIEGKEDILRGTGQAAPDLDTAAGAGRDRCGAVRAAAAVRARAERAV